jgi:hypothetical protein
LVVLFLFLLLLPANVYAASDVPFSDEPASSLGQRIPEQALYIAVALTAALSTSSASRPVLIRESAESPEPRLVPSQGATPDAATEDARKRTHTAGAGIRFGRHGSGSRTSQRSFDRRAPRSDRRRGSLCCSSEAACAKRSDSGGNSAARGERVRCVGAAG